MRLYALSTCALLLLAGAANALTIDGFDDAASVSVVGVPGTDS